MYGLRGLVVWLFVALCLGWLWQARGFLQEQRGRIVQDLRKFLGWVFAISSLLCLWHAPRLMFDVIRNQSSLFLRSASIAALFPVLAVIYGVALWTIWKEKPYAKVWAIAASATYVLINLSLVHWLVSVPSCVWVMSAVGVAGLVVFLWRDHDQIPSESPD
jgi:predicted permease